MYWKPNVAKHVEMELVFHLQVFSRNSSLKLEKENTENQHHPEVISRDGDIWTHFIEEI